MLKNLLKLIFPKLCNGCQELLLLNESIICSNCRHNLPLTNHHLISNNDITKKFYGIIDVEFSASMLYFQKDGIVQKLIHNLKYKGQEKVGFFLGEWYANDLIKNEIINTVTEIIPVPLHTKRLEERGYNQVDGFCIALSKELNIPFNKSLLYRRKYSKTQTAKNKTERQFENDNVFDVTFSKKDENKHFLLIDDVITTGSTLELCAKMLLKIPNSKVSIVTIAFTQS
jgi:ComF family protein